MNSNALLHGNRYTFARELPNLLSGTERTDFVRLKNIDYNPKGKNYEVIKAYISVKEIPWY